MVSKFLSSENFIFTSSFTLASSSPEPQGFLVHLHRPSSQHAAVSRALCAFTCSSTSPGESAGH